MSDAALDETALKTASRATLGQLGLKAKLALIMTSCFVITILSIAMVDFFESRTHLYEIEEHTSVTFSDMLAKQMSGAIKFGKVDRMQAIFDGLEFDKENRLASIIVIGNDGTVVAELGDPGMVQTALSVLPTGENDAVPQEVGHNLYVPTPVISLQTAENLGTMVSVWDRSVLQEEIISSLLKSLLVAGTACAIGLAAIIWTSSRLVVAPLGALASAMDRIGSKDYETDVPFTERQDEVGTVGRNLLAFRNRLAAEENASARHRAEEARKQELFSQLSHALSEVAAGDMNLRIDLSITDGLEASSRQVCEDFNALMDGFGNVIAAVVTSAETVRTSSAEISEVANAQSRRSEAQASTLEESAAALDGLTKSVKSAAEHASEADSAVSENRRQAEASGDVVRRAVSAMQQIEESSSQITQIISVIDDIAFQTNLLALNAGVEAARAGESGRGFAVVASEVRALAQRASESAREIKDLISTSGQQVSEGGALVSQTGDALAEIIGRFGKVSELVSNIAVSLREQSTGLEEINVGINELDKVTQQNAAVIEETSASSQALSAEAERLSLVLRKFKLDTRSAQANLQAAVGSSYGSASSEAGTPNSHEDGEDIKSWSTALQEPVSASSDADDWQDF